MKALQGSLTSAIPYNASHPVCRCHGQRWAAAVLTFMPGAGHPFPQALLCYIEAAISFEVSREGAKYCLSFGLADNTLQAMPGLAA